MQRLLRLRSDEKAVLSPLSEEIECAFYFTLKAKEKPAKRHSPLRGNRQ